MKTKSMLLSCTLLLATFCVPAQAGTVADQDAGRIGAIYRYTQGLAALMVPNLSVPNIGALRGGPFYTNTTQYNCPAGGTVTYRNDQPSTNPVAPPKSKITWANCHEAIGVINGTMSAARGNATSGGGYNISWTANVTIDGYTHRFKSSASTVDVNPDGTTSLYSFGGADTELVFSTPTSETVMFTDVFIHLRHDASAATLDLDGTDVRMRSVETSERRAALVSAYLSVPAASGFSAFDVGTPTIGSFGYVRSFDATAVDVIGSGAVSANLSLTLDPLPSPHTFGGDSGVYGWSGLIASPILALPASAP